MLNPTLSALYQRVILEHSATPHGLGPLPAATHSAALHNALCGDQITLRLQVVTTAPEESPTIAAAGFEGESCALCRASASLLCKLLPGRTLQAALTLSRELQDFLRPRRATGPGQTSPETSPETPQALDDAAQADRLGDLSALVGVRDFPSRQRCATLPWEALGQALSTTSR